MGRAFSFSPDYVFSASRGVPILMHFVSWRCGFSFSKIFCFSTVQIYHVLSSSLCGSDARRLTLSLFPHDVVKLCPTKHDHPGTILPNNHSWHLDLSPMLRRRNAFRKLKSRLSTLWFLSVYLLDLIVQVMLVDSQYLFVVPVPFRFLLLHIIQLRVDAGKRRTVSQYDCSFARFSCKTCRASFAMSP